MICFPFTANKSNSNGPSAGQQQSATSSQSNTGWGQPGGAKPQTGGSPSTGTVTSGTAANTQQGSTGQQGTSTTSTKQQLEQLNNMREAIFSQDGWGGVSILFYFIGNKKCVLIFCVRIEKHNISLFDIAFEVLNIKNRLLYKTSSFENGEIESYVTNFC